MKRPVPGARRWQSMARWAVPVVCVVTGLALAPSGSAAVNALIVGKLVNCGGPHHAGRSNCFLQDHAVISAYSSSHRMVARETVTNGHFSFLVRPGRFTLVAKTSDSRTTQRSVTAEADKTVHCKLVFHIH